ncbi:class I adenylate-forming enzyme family protein [Nocardiopsis sp. FIRDI 009]|uniref:class I adenylate-forming enzyme family protein n=1 Tax=Nocardiopsis sp. FIRDI 009 TaxID=714197 RepID=UPI000E277E57|nr:class I adenylate-forming enzyme family protein [Nocardiopsis sp. FIRDI 009]
MTPRTFPDLVPAHLRARWRDEGHYLGMGVYQLFRTVALAHPDRDAVVDDHGRVTYAALHREVLSVAGALTRLGVRPGEVVAVQLPNQAAAVATELAIAAVGAVALPFPVGRGSSEVEALLRGSGAVLLVAATEHRGRSPLRTAEALRPRLPDLRWAVGVDGRGRLLSATVSPADESDLPEVDASSAARILVSSGSEAQPKMVAYSHDALAGGRGNFVASLRRGADPLRAHFLVPLGSAFGSNATSVVLARHGGTLLLNDHFDADRALATIADHHPTHVLGVPTMIRMMLDLNRCPRPGDGAVLVLGGAPLDPDTARRARKVFGGPVVNLYGSADGVNCHTGLDGDPCDESGPGRPAGRPDPGVVSIRVVDADGRDVAAGATGEIVALGPMSPLCHVGGDGADERHRTADGWVRTGDLGVLDERGLLRVVGRLKDVVIRGGANISPAEVESAVRTHPAVADACCFGTPDPLMGERLVAALVPRGGTEPPDVAALAVHLKEGGLDPFKCPERVLRVGRLPLTAAGKVDRDALRALVD